MKGILVMMIILLIGSATAWAEKIPDWQARYIFFQFAQGKLTDAQVTKALNNDNLFTATPENTLLPPNLQGQYLLLLSNTKKK